MHGDRDEYLDEYIVQLEDGRWAGEWTVREEKEDDHAEDSVQSLRSAGGC